MASGAGSLEWARRTHGRLSARDRAELLAQGARRMAYLLQIGAAVDVTGFRLRDFDRSTRDAILARHPRRGMKSEFAAVMDDEVVRHPDSRPAFFTRRVGFKRMIERAPFDD